MKTNFFLTIILIVFVTTKSFSQYKKDGTPDMRYKANKQTTSNYNYSVPNNDVKFQSGYVKDNGTYVEPHYKTNKNSTNHDNLSTKDNYNIYNNTSGYKAKDYSTDAYNYGSDKNINQGPKGGQYYINDKGNKVYVPKR